MPKKGLDAALHIKSIDWFHMWATLGFNGFNVTSKTEQLPSFKLLERTHFQQTFHWIDIWIIS